MDYIVWSRIIMPLAIVVFIIYVIISSNRAAKELAQKKSEPNNQVENKDSLSPFSDNLEEFLLETELTHQTVESTEAEMPMVVEQTKPKPILEIKPIEPPPVPVDSPTSMPTKSVPITSLIDPSPNTFRQGIILAEILGRPKGLRRRL